MGSQSAGSPSSPPSLSLLTHPPFAPLPPLPPSPLPSFSPQILQAAQMALALLEDSCRLASRLHSIVNGNPKGLHLDRKQCEFLSLQNLVPVLRELLQTFGLLTLPARANCCLCFQELYFVLCDAEKLIRDRSSREWLIKALKRLGNGSDFCIVQFRIRWILRVVRAMMAQSCETPGSDADAWIRRSLLPPAYDEILEHVVRDTEDLKIKLEGLKRKWKRNLFKRSSLDLYLANFLSEELNALNLRASDRQRSLNMRLPDYLWVEEKKIKQERSLGRGAFGVVRECTWLNKKFAAKTFNRARNPDFEIEAAIQLNQRHPHIVQLICCSSDTECCLVMERMEMSLSDFIDQQEEKPPFSLLKAVDIMIQIAEGMKYLHSRNVFHCDLKASNILVKRKKINGISSCDYICAKLADFGMAKTKFKGNKITTSVYQLGTMHWKAPETLVNERKHYTTKADVYSFAITCFEILTGDSPCTATVGMKAHKRKIRKGYRPELPSELPSYLSAFIQKCWDGTADNRPEFDSICAMLRHFKGILLRFPQFDQCWSYLAPADLDEIRRHVGLKLILQEVERSHIPINLVANWFQTITNWEELKLEVGFCELVTMVGDHLANLKGVYYDLERATALFREAAERGSEVACQRLKLLVDLQLQVQRTNSIQNCSAQIGTIPEFELSSTLFSISDVNERCSSVLSHIQESLQLETS